MLRKNLVILDVDGTLVHSLKAEALLFPRACEQALGITNAPTQFEAYRCPSDHGIVRELVEVHFGREAHEKEYQAVEDRFLELIRGKYTQNPEFCSPVAGAIDAVSRLGQLPDIALSIATAGWRRTALYKLGFAGYDVGELPMATSKDAERKADIMKIAVDRASAHYGVDEFASIICFGDSKGDANAARVLGYGFIGIDTSGFISDEEPTFNDLSDFNAVAGAMFAMQKKMPINRPIKGVDGTQSESSC